MLQIHSSSIFSLKYHPLQKAGCIRTLESPVTHIHGVLNRSQEKKYAIKCSQSNSFYNLTNKIASSRNCKPFNSHRAPVTLQDGYASKSEDDDNSNSFLNVFLKKFYALYRFMRAYACAGVIIATTSNSLLPVQTLADLTPAYFTGLLEALVPAVLMHIYVVAINQLSDVEVDKVNKPYLPLASGEISMGTGIAITLASALMSLAYAVMIRSPPFIWAVIAWIFVGTAYSVQIIGLSHPFHLASLLRWKGNSFLAAFCMVSLNGLLTQFPVYVHIQKYVLGRPLEIFTRPLMFATAFISCFCVVIAFIKDLHDVDGDKKFGIKTLSVMLGKERVFRLSVSMLSIAYGAAVVVGASSPFLANKLITIIGHCILASIFWLRVRAVDLSDNASILSFYMFIWKLYYAEYLLIPFVR